MEGGFSWFGKLTLIGALIVLAWGMASADPAHTNRLIREKSPYLLQHAHNPVDWYPWGEEAFEKARREKKPIFLSVGYSTCHWCHVMERESFEDPETAAFMNEHFVSVKVDREERPDVDALYMRAVMQMTGQGGWPMSVFLTPDREPFYGGTYFPPEDRWGRPGFKSVLRSIARAWESRPEEVLRSAEAMTQALRSEQEGAAAAGAPLTEKTLTHAAELFSGAFDARYGGFGDAPKFPRSPSLSLLLRLWRRSGDPKLLEMVERTLQAMAAGGIRDQLGGGFHRYSTDAEWHVPHFEKMLYDQALLAKTYLEAFQATGKEEYAATAREIFEYVLRDLTGPEGAFYSAEDADSEGREGAFYVWTAKEVEEVLGKADAEEFGRLYGVQLHGNAGHDPMGEFAGRNILYRAHPAGPGQQELVRRCRVKLLAARSRRPRPHRDDKVLADWNGLMISSFAFGARVLDEPKYAQAARRAADFLLEKLVRKDGRLLHRWRDGDAAIPAHLEDYAFLVHGLVDLYQAAFEGRYLKEAGRLTNEMIRLFWDERGGGFFLAGTDAEKLLARQKEFYDGALPSGNSVAALDLIRVGRLTEEGELEGKASRLMDSVAGQVDPTPSSYPQLLIALELALGPSREVVIAGEASDAKVKEMLREMNRRFLPDTVVALRPPGDARWPTAGGRPTAYVCRNGACDLPTSDLVKLRELLERP